MKEKNTNGENAIKEIIDVLTEHDLTYSLVSEKEELDFKNRNTDMKPQRGDHSGWLNETTLVVYGKDLLEIKQKLQILYVDQKKDAESPRRS